MTSYQLSYCESVAPL